MATEPERKIERLLRAYAQKRRRDAGEPPERSLAMRQQLQAEVARRFGSEPAEGRSWLEQFVAAHWGKLAIASCAAALLLIALVSMYPPAEVGSEHAELAYVRSAQQVPAQTATQEIAPAKSRTTDSFKAPELPLQAESLTPAVPAFSRAQVSAVNGMWPGEKSKQDKLEATMTVSRDLGIVITGGHRLGGEATFTLTPSDSEARATSAIVALQPDQIQPSGVVTEGVLDTTVLAFRNVAVQVPPGAAPGQTMPAQILNTFKIEQHGAVLNVVDEDGSAYTGFVQPAEPIQLLRGGTLTNVTGTVSGAVSDQVAFGGLGAPGKAPGSGSVNAQTAHEPFVGAPVQNYFFRVTGTNRALNQHVIFTGQLLVEPVAEAQRGEAAAGIAARVGPGGVGGSGIRQVGIPQAQALRVTGTAVLGHTQAITIDAISASHH